MTKNLYKQHCLDYLNKGLSVIPDRYGKKKPLIKEWNKYGTQLPTREEVIQWGTRFHESNIAVMLGEQSKIVAVDVDTKDPAYRKIIEDLMPVNPNKKCEKHCNGKFTRFYKYTGEQTQVLKDKDKNVILELLSTGKKTTIPPSVHTSGLPYEWVGKSLLDSTELPILPPHLFSTIELRINDSQLTSLLKPKKTSGRHYFLGALSSQLIAEQTELNAAIHKLIDADIKENKIPLFSDHTEFDHTNAYLNALKFYTDYLKSINTKRIKEGLHLELPLSASNKVISTLATKKDDPVLLPEPTGLLKDIKDHILASSYIEQPVFALSGALTLLGTLASRKFSFQGATPNTYILNIADSGSGKDSCQQTIKQIIKAVGAADLLGATTYPSEASIIVNLDLKPTRLDIIDEAASFLQTAAHGGTAYQNGIGDTLCELYSCAGNEYLGKVLASNFGKSVGRCSRPHINLLCSTTYKGISEALSRAVLEKGLFARFLTFFGENNKQGKRLVNRPSMDIEMIEQLQKIYKFENPLFTGNMPMNAPSYELKCTNEADKLLTKYHAIFDTMRIKCDSNSVTRPVIARLYQQMLKIVLVSAVGRYNGENIPKVQESDVEFAYQLVLFFYRSIEGFIEDNLFDSKRGQQVIQVMRMIKEAGNEGILSSDLTKYTKALTVRDRLDILKDLIASRQVEVLTTKDPNISLFKEVKH